MPTETTDLLDYRGLNPAITYNDGVRLSSPLIVFLNRLRDILPADIPIHVNSGLRTAEEQARAMLAKQTEADRQHAADVAAGKTSPRRSGVAELLAIYDDAVIARLRSVPTSSWASVIEDLAAHGILVSPHLEHGSGALDIRDRNLSESDVATLLEAVAQLGAKGLREYAPPHVHVQGINRTVTTQGPPLRPIERVTPGGGGVDSGGLLVLGLTFLGAAFGAALTGGSS